MMEAEPPPQPPASTSASSHKLTGGYLLVILSEPFSQEHKERIVQKVSKGLLSWDVDSTGCDLVGIENVCKYAEVEEGTDMLIQHATETLAIEVLLNPEVNTVKQCLKNLLASTTRHKHLIHAGYSFAGSGSWILQDGAFAFRDFADAFQDAEAQRILRAFPECSVHVHCTPEGDWSRANLEKQTFSRMAHLSVNPPDKITSLPGASALLECLENALVCQSLEEVMKSSSVVGNIRFHRPTLYVFPGGQGDCALFGVSGFNMLIDGGFNRKPCFWEFIRHLDRLDAVLVTRLSESNLCGVSSMFKRKVNEPTYPQIGYVFCNIAEVKYSPSDEIQKDRDELLVSVISQGHEFLDNLYHLELKPHLCYRASSMEPFTLFHKVGHGTLEMYVISPPKESRELKDFLYQWASYRDSFTFVKTGMRFEDKELTIPLSHSMSICALLIWKPADPKDTVTRIFFPGSAPQNKILEGLDKLKHLTALRKPVVLSGTVRASDSDKAKMLPDKPLSRMPISKARPQSPAQLARRSKEHSPSRKETTPSTEKKPEPVKHIKKADTSKKVEEDKKEPIVKKTPIKKEPKPSPKPIAEPAKKAEAATKGTKDVANKKVVEAKVVSRRLEPTKAKPTTATPPSSPAKPFRTRPPASLPVGSPKHDIPTKTTKKEKAAPLPKPEKVVKKAPVKEDSNKKVVESKVKSIRPAKKRDDPMLSKKGVAKAAAAAAVTAASAVVISAAAIEQIEKELEKDEIMQVEVTDKEAEVQEVEVQEEEIVQEKAVEAASAPPAAGEEADEVEAKVDEPAEAEAEDAAAEKEDEAEVTESVEAETEGAEAEEAVEAEEEATEAGEEDQTEDKEVDVTEMEAGEVESVRKEESEEAEEAKGDEDTETKEETESKDDEVTEDIESVKEDESKEVDVEDASVEEVIEKVDALKVESSAVEDVIEKTDAITVESELDTKGESEKDEESKEEDDTKKDQEPDIKGAEEPEIEVLASEEAPEEEELGEKGETEEKETEVAEDAEEEEKEVDDKGTPEIENKGEDIETKEEEQVTSKQPADEEIIEVEISKEKIVEIEASKEEESEETAEGHPEVEEMLEVASVVASELEEIAAALRSKPMLLKSEKEEDKQEKEDVDEIEKGSEESTEKEKGGEISKETAEIISQVESEVIAHEKADSGAEEAGKTEDIAAGLIEEIEAQIEDAIEVQMVKEESTTTESEKKGAVAEETKETVKAVSKIDEPDEDEETTETEQEEADAEVPQDTAEKTIGDTVSAEAEDEGVEAKEAVLQETDGVVETEDDKSGTVVDKEIHGEESKSSPREDERDEKEVKTSAEEAKDTVEKEDEHAVVEETEAKDTVKKEDEHAVVEETEAKDTVKKEDGHAVVEETEAKDTVKKEDEHAAVEETEAKDTVKKEDEHAVVEEAETKDTVEKEDEHAVVEETEAKDTIEKADEHAVVEETEAKDTVEKEDEHADVEETEAKVDKEDTGVEEVKEESLTKSDQHVVETSKTPVETEHKESVAVEAEDAVEKDVAEVVDEEKKDIPQAEDKTVDVEEVQDIVVTEEIIEAATAHVDLKAEKAVESEKESPKEDLPESDEADTKDMKEGIVDIPVSPAVSERSIASLEQQLEEKTDVKDLNLDATPVTISPVSQVEEQISPAVSERSVASVEPLEKESAPPPSEKIPASPTPSEKLVSPAPSEKEQKSSAVSVAGDEDAADDVKSIVSIEVQGAEEEDADEKDVDTAEDKDIGDAVSVASTEDLKERDASLKAEEGDLKVMESTSGPTSPEPISEELDDISTSHIKKTASPLSEELKIAGFQKEASEVDEEEEEEDADEKGDEVEETIHIATGIRVLESTPSPDKEEGSLKEAAEQKKSDDEKDQDSSEVELGPETEVSAEVSPISDKEYIETIEITGKSAEEEGTAEYDAETHSLNIEEEKKESTVGKDELHSSEESVEKDQEYRKLQTDMEEHEKEGKDEEDVGGSFSEKGHTSDLSDSKQDKPKDVPAVSTLPSAKGAESHSKEDITNDEKSCSDMEKSRKSPAVELEDDFVDEGIAEDDVVTKAKLLELQATSSAIEPDAAQALPSMRSAHPDTTFQHKEIDFEELEDQIEAKPLDKVKSTSPLHELRDIGDISVKHSPTPSDTISAKEATAISRTPSPPSQSLHEGESVGDAKASLHSSKDSLIDDETQSKDNKYIEEIDSDIKTRSPSPKQDILDVQQKESDEIGLEATPKSAASISPARTPSPIIDSVPDNDTRETGEVKKMEASTASPTPSSEVINASETVDKQLTQSPSPQPEIIKEDDTAVQDATQRSPSPQTEDIHQDDLEPRRKLSETKSIESLPGSKSPDPKSIHPDVEESTRKLSDASHGATTRSPSPKTESFHDDVEDTSSKLSNAKSHESIARSPSPKELAIHEDEKETSRKLSDAKSHESITRSPSPKAQSIHDDEEGHVSKLSDTKSNESITRSPSPKVETITDDLAEPLRKLSDSKSHDSTTRSPSPKPNTVHDDVEEPSVKQIDTLSSQTTSRSPSPKVMATAGDFEEPNRKLSDAKSHDSTTRSPSPKAESIPDDISKDTSKLGDEKKHESITRSPSPGYELVEESNIKMSYVTNQEAVARSPSPKAESIRDDISEKSTKSDGVKSHEAVTRSPSPKQHSEAEDISDVDKKGGTAKSLDTDSRTRSPESVHEEVLELDGTSRKHSLAESQAAISRSPSPKPETMLGEATEEKVQLKEAKSHESIPRSPSPKAESNQDNLSEIGRKLSDTRSHDTHTRSPSPSAESIHDSISESDRKLSEAKSQESVRSSSPKTEQAVEHESDSDRKISPSPKPDTAEMKSTDVKDADISGSPSPKAASLKDDVSESGRISSDLKLSEHEADKIEIVEPSSIASKSEDLEMLPKSHSPIEEILQEDVSGLDRKLSDSKSDIGHTRTPSPQSELGATKKEGDVRDISRSPSPQPKSLKEDSLVQEKPHVEETISKSVSPKLSLELGHELEIDHVSRSPSPRTESLTEDDKKKLEFKSTDSLARSPSPIEVHSHDKATEIPTRSPSPKAETPKEVIPNEGTFITSSSPFHEEEKTSSETLQKGQADSISPRPESSHSQDEREDKLSAASEDGIKECSSNDKSTANEMEEKIITKAPSPMSELAHEDTTTERLEGRISKSPSPIRESVHEDVITESVMTSVTKSPPASKTPSPSPGSVLAHEDITTEHLKECISKSPSPIREPVHEDVITESVMTSVTKSPPSSKTPSPSPGSELAHEDTTKERLEGRISKSPSPITESVHEDVITESLIASATKSHSSSKAPSPSPGSELAHEDTATEHTKESISKSPSPIRESVHEDILTESLITSATKSPSPSKTPSPSPRSESVHEDSISSKVQHEIQRQISDTIEVQLPERSPSPQIEVHDEFDEMVKDANIVQQLTPSKTSEVSEEISVKHITDDGSSYTRESKTDVTFDGADKISEGFSSGDIINTGVSPTHPEVEQLETDESIKGKGSCAKSEICDDYFERPTSESEYFSPTEAVKLSISASSLVESGSEKAVSTHSSKHSEDGLSDSEIKGTTTEVDSKKDISSTTTKTVQQSSLKSVDTSQDELDSTETCESNELKKGGDISKSPTNQLDERINESIEVSTTTAQRPLAIPSTDTISASQTSQENGIKDEDFKSFPTSPGQPTPGDRVDSARYDDYHQNIMDEQLPEETEEPEDDAVSIIEEQPIYGNTLQADFAELVTLSEANTPSEPQSPLDAKVKLTDVSTKNQSAAEKSSLSASDVQSLPEDTLTKSQLISESQSSMTSSGFVSPQYEIDHTKESQQSSESSCKGSNGHSYDLMTASYHESYSEEPESLLKSSHFDKGNLELSETLAESDLTSGAPTSFRGVWDSSVRHVESPVVSNGSPARQAPVEGAPKLKQTDHHSTKAELFSSSKEPQEDCMTSSFYDFGEDDHAPHEEETNGKSYISESTHSKTLSGQTKTPSEISTSFSSSESASKAVKDSSNASGKSKDFSLDDWGKPLGLPSPPEPGDTVHASTTNKSANNTPKAAKAKISSSNKEEKKSSRTAPDNGGKPNSGGSPSKSSYNKSSSGKGGREAGTPVYVDLTYVPHHANPYYCNVEFFQRVRARYYVFSGTNPSKEVFNALLEAKRSWEDKNMEVTIIPTYETDTLGYWMASNQDLLTELKIDVAPSANRCTISLQDHETSCAAYRLEF